MNFYIGDLHFGHRSVINFDHRPFADADEMDRAMIDLWNSRVSEDDEVYVLGDFAYRNYKPEEWYLRQLKGAKHLIVGNHDWKLMKNPGAMRYFQSVEKMCHVSDAGTHICLCHFPIADWNGRYKGHYHIYAHIHGQNDEVSRYMKQFDRALNASACINYYMPVSFKELVRNNERWRDESG